MPGYEFTELIYSSDSRKVLKYEIFTGLGRQGSGNQNIDFNSFNVDMGATWRFAPGSELTVVWKNSILNQNKLFQITIL